MVVDLDVLGGRYTIVERVAVGGMGAVYRATDNRLGRTVALKLLKDGLAHDDRFVERFRREARSAAGLTHPNIASVFDYGEDEGRHFIVMELADGRDLARLLLDEGPLPADRALKIAAATADALGHAHRMGVIHRDVKPANIMVDPHDRVKVTDFGIARAAGDSTLTQAGTILGTAFYLSPEQASGDNLGPHSDVYSLGVVLYEMLTGAVPFSADSPVSVAMKHLNEDVPTPSRLKPDVTPEIDALVTVATAKDPSARPSDGAEYAARIRRVIETSAPPVAVAAPTGTGLVAAGAVGASTKASEPAPSDTERLWVLPGPDVEWRRVVPWTFAVLGGLVILLLAFRAATEDPVARRATDRGGPAQRDADRGAEEDPDGQVQTAGIAVPSDIVGRDAEEVQKELEALGLKGERVPIESDYEKHQVVGTDPPPGSEVQPGATVTLYESEGPADESEGEDKDKDKEPPGQEKKEDEDD